MYLNKSYRSEKYCEIPKCEDFKWVSVPCSSRYLPEPNHQLINCNSDEKLTCGCLPFELDSHDKDCIFHNSNEKYNLLLELTECKIQQDKCKEKLENFIKSVKEKYSNENNI